MGRQENVNKGNLIYIASCIIKSRTDTPSMQVNPFHAEIDKSDELHCKLWRYQYLNVLLVCLSVGFARGAPPWFELRTGYVNGTHASQIFQRV